MSIEIIAHDKGLGEGGDESTVEFGEGDVLMERNVSRAESNWLVVYVREMD